MHQLIKNLKNNGVKEKYLRDDESIVVNQLLNLGIVYRKYVDWKSEKGDICRGKKFKKDTYR